jgi:hypothetical protein
VPILPKTVEHSDFHHVTALHGIPWYSPTLHIQICKVLSDTSFHPEFQNCIPKHKFSCRLSKFHTQEQNSYLATKLHTESQILMPGFKILYPGTKFIPGYKIAYLGISFKPGFKIAYPGNFFKYLASKVHTQVQMFIPLFKIAYPCTNLHTAFQNFIPR